LSKYKHIFFDLDHTLWDYDTNATDSLFELFDKHQLDKLDRFGKEDLAKTFFEVNYDLWDLYNVGKIQRPDIRERRFPAIFDRLGANRADVPATLELEYVSLAPTKSATFVGAHDILEYLSEKYELHIITNGFDDIQAIKLESSNMDQFFDVIITSETTAYRKPDKEIFELAMDRAGAQLEHSMMIGDNLESDIRGAMNVGMDHVWFNPEGKDGRLAVQHEIQNLIQLKGIL
jgi:putative hydrolase of the HAD superfamily